MELSEAIKLLKEGVVNSVGNERTGMAESPKEYTQAVNEVLQSLEDTEKANEMELWEIKLRIGLIEEELEVLENYSLNNWQRFGFEKEAVAVKRIRNATDDCRELLKGE